MTKSTSTKPVARPIQKTKKQVPQNAEHVLATTHLSTLKQFLHSHGHAILAFFYALQALAILLLAKTYTIAITSTYVAKDSLTSSATGETVLSSASRHFADINIGYLVAVVFLIASLTHLALSIIRKRDTWNQSTIRRHGRRVRWTGLTLSVAGLVVVTALLLGMRDITSLVALSGLIFVAGVIGYLVEEHQKISKRIIVLLGVISTVLPALLLAITTLHAGMYGNLTSTLLALSLTLLFGAFIAFTAFYYVVIAKKPVRFSVAAYSTILIFIIESAVLWQIFASYLRS